MLSSIFIKHLTQWSVPTVMETVAKAAIMALAAYILPKSDFGILTLVMLIYSYHPYLQLGILDGLIIKLPGYFVQGRIEKICSSLGLTLSFSLSVIVLSILFGITFSIVNGQYNRTVLVCGIYLLTAIPYTIYNHYLLLNRYTYDLKTTFIARSFNAGLRLFFQAPLIYFYGIYGLAIGEVLIYVISTALLLHSSKIHVRPNLNLQNLKDYLIFGVPVWGLSFLGLVSFTLERSISAYYFDLRSVADIGLLAFFGALFIQTNGQILSLFSQYSREFFVKERDTVTLMGAYMVYLQGSIFAYITAASFFYGIMAFFIIPEYLSKYLSVITLLPIVYAIFLARILLSVLFNLLLVIGDRKNLFIGHAVFLVGTIFVLLSYHTFSEFTLTVLLVSILAGTFLEFVFLLTVCVLKSKNWVMGVWLFLTTVTSCSLPIYFFMQGLDSWFFMGFASLVIWLMIAISFLQAKKSREGWRHFRSIVQKKFL